MNGVLLTTVLVITVVPLVVQSNTATTRQGFSREALTPWTGGWRALMPTSSYAPSRIPLTISTTDSVRSVNRMSRVGLFEEDDDEEVDEGRKGGNKKMFKKYRRYMLPLLLAYKLKFFTLIPVFIGGLILLTGATGLAGFFFALFAAVMGLKNGGSDH